MIGFIVSNRDAQQAPEAEDGNVDENTREAGECVDEYIADGTGATGDGELVNFVNGAIDGSDDERIDEHTVGWVSFWMQTFREAGKRIAKEPKEENMRKFARDAISEP